MNDLDIKLSRLKEIIRKDGLVFGNQKKIISPSGKEEKWIFDLRNVLLQPESLQLITDIFWHYFEKEYPFQIGGQELSSVPLVSAIVFSSHQRKKPVNGFIIRKSRKPLGLQKIIEGQLTNDKIILIDDLIGTGTAFEKQAKVLVDIGRKADYFFTLLNFREQENIEKIKKQGAQLVSLFTLYDFGLVLDSTDKLPTNNFRVAWKFKAPEPNYLDRIPKSAPCIDDKKIYFGSDSGYFFALDQDNGAVAWKYKVGYAVNGKSIFSSPAICEDTVFFGSYDGNVYALDKDTGKAVWKYMDADFVGSSPALAPDLDLLFIGLEFGLFRKHGGIAALNLKTGKKIWNYKMSRFTHSSPAYCHSKKIVAIGCNDRCVYLFDAKNGKLKWKFRTNGEIKASLCFDTNRNLLLFGSFDKNIYALDIDTGELRGKFETRDLVYSTPIIYKNNVIFGSLDKNIYSFNLDTGKLNWRLATNGRIFSSPEIIDNNVFIGSNDGRMYEIDANSGKTVSFFQATERITNKIAHNPKKNGYFLPTYANEIYCLEKYNNSGA